MGTNRIAKYFPTLELTMTNNKFNHVEFEKFDPSITQNIVREFSNDDEIEGYVENEQEEFGNEKVTVTQDNQMLQTLNLWIGHCNVDITPILVNKLKFVNGVETLDIMTRYRFRVGIAKLFDENTVKTEIAATIDRSVKS